MKRLFSLILVGMLAVSGLSAKVKLSVLYVGGTANMDPMLMAPGSVDSVVLQNIIFFHQKLHQIQLKVFVNTLLFVKYRPK